MQRLLKEGKSLGDLIIHLKNILQADGNGTSTSSSSAPSSSPSSPRMSSTLPPRITRSKVSSATATATSTSTVVAGGILGQRSASPSGTDVDPVDAVCVLLQLVRWVIS